MSYGLIDDHDWFELYILFWCCPTVPSVSRKWRDPRCRVLQYVNGSLMVGGVSDKIHIPEFGGHCVWDKEDLILNDMVEFHDLNDL